MVKSGPKKRTHKKKNMNYTIMVILATLVHLTEKDEKKVQCRVL